jgi:cytidine deaminase
MNAELERLVEAARTVREQSYSPYSHFAVGAALLGASGRIYVGTNVENASFGLSICAERAAVYQAVSAGERDFRAVAVYAGTAEPTPPCGACRQVLLEFGPEMTVVLAARDGSCEEHRLLDLLARPFAGLDVDGKEG